MKDLPYFKFVAHDWISALNVVSMTCQQRGAYIMLLAQAWTQETCSLPDNRVLLKKLALWDGSDEEFTPVIACFTPLSKGGALVNKRQYKDWLEAKQWRRTQQEHGKQGAATRWATPIKKEKTPAPVVPLVDWLTTLKTNPAYAHINIEMELGKMDAWLSTKPGRKKTKSFVVNWLNKIEAPLASNGSGTRPPPPPPKNDPIGRGIWGRTYGHPKDHGYD